MNRRTSLKYLLGAGLSGSAIVAVYKFTGWESPDIEYLAGKQPTIAELAEMIIPRTDTPGAKDARVDQFIIRMITEGSDKKTQRNFIKGLKQLEQYALNYYENEFINCSYKSRYQILSYYEKSSGYSSAILNKISNRLLGKPFFIKLKELTVEGYCTSEVGAMQGLAFDYVPGDYLACTPLQLNQKSWATK
ncbi:gluconate 2-dehydrogenase subunit 3 family protein [Pedobacter antarcticus]|uniref:Gluconate 2-dehydrogenase subunit 3 family protein n=2 Tax=Pedobacter antarcticus TaxID=34086 RepID=A0A081PDR8_9SPHI|nr:gluconate 2-dehydrogenase subunit 3 family protein [Pedobacter antarcticus]KEQ28841.1 hypothetical protein N180_19555 [Pedobacter antarcticus 4BY]SDM28110.1 Gluconate 2-dehydrogenase subunit 3 [Pedobacter antarcticus]SFF20424.1 Gluconate 2-dehydrogenase subunit 3 [Pedobacter antarcticus]